MEENKFNISTLAQGAISEQIEIASQRVYDNIYDPNTDGEKARKLTVELTFKPSKNDRTLIDVTSVVKTSLQPQSAVNTSVLIGVDNNGEVVGEEWNRSVMKGQVEIETPSEVEKADGVIDLQKRKAE